jgi:uncharacterized protein with PIN domain
MLPLEKNQDTRHTTDGGGSESTLAFAVDRTLGRLAKWLRIMGFDTVCESDATGSAYPGLAEEKRVLLTRNTALRPAWGPLLLIRSNHLRDQLREVVQSLDIRQDQVELFARCLVCNIPVEHIEKEAARHRVPDYVWESQTTFSRCPECGRLYWPGTHADRSRDMIREVFR